MADHVGIKRYENFYGLDLKSSDLQRPDGFSSDMANAEYLKNGAIAKRKGFQSHAASQGGFGFYCYNRVNISDGTEAPELVNLDSSPYKLSFSSLTITYVGADPTALVNIFFDPTTDVYRCQLLDGSTTSLDQSLGLGFDEASPYTVDQLRAAIDALANWTCTLTGSTSTPAAFLKIVRDHDSSATGSVLVAKAGYWSAINTTVSTPFAGSNTNKNDSDFENISSVQINNIIYFSNGYDEVHKYDGQTCYRAGVPKPATVTSALGGAGAITGSNYGYRVAYVQKDNSANFIEGNTLDTTVGLAPAAQTINVTVANVLAGTGFNTNCATVNGLQSGITTITVNNSPHTLQVGDTAYFFDSSTLAYVERTITARTATTITISGAGVNVLNGDVISNNLRIAIFRSKTGGSFPPTVFYLVAEIPNNSLAATQVYNDAKTDATLGAQFIDHVSDRSVPPKGKYVSQFRGQMVISGQIGLPNTVFFSDIDGPEYHPLGVNEFQVDTPIGDQVSGLSPNNELFAVMKTKSIHIVSGDIGNLNFRVDQLTSDIGCAAHASIQEVRGSLYFLSDRGPYVMTGGQIPQPLGGNRIEPAFDQEGFASTLILKTKRAIGFNHRDQEQYILYIPTENTTSSQVWSNSFSRIFVHDYTRDAFLEWNTLNMSGGIAFCDGELYWVERKYSTFSSAVKYKMNRRLNLGDAYDYQDNESPIVFEYKSGWETLGEPSILKRFLRLRTFSVEETNNNSLELDFETEINYIKDVVHTSGMISFATGGYGSSEYGNAAYGDPAEPIDKEKLRPGRIRALRVVYRHSDDQQNVNITAWELEAAAPFRFGFKS